MEKNTRTPEECLDKLLPVRDALDILKGKWKIQIISVLVYYDNCGFKQLRDNVPGITPKMLSKELKELEINLMVDRTVSDSRPITVNYKITEYGKSVTPVIYALYQWGQQHRDTIIESMRKKD